MKRIIRPQTQLRSLSRTISEFARLTYRVEWPSRPGLRGGMHQPVPVSTAYIVPEGGKFIEATYSNTAGTRAYKLYIPSRYQGQAPPLIVMLHGGTQTPDDFAAGTRMNLIAEEETCLVAYPAQPSHANPAKCWNWFRSDDQRRGRGEPSLIAGITRKVMHDYSVDPQRVYVGGLSAGAAAAAVMGATYPDLYAAIGVHSGLAFGVADDLISAFAAMRQGGFECSSEFGETSAVFQDERTVPTIVFHGDRDAIVHPRNADNVIARSMKIKNWQKKVHRGQVPGGHAYTRTIHTDENGRAIFEQWCIHGAGHAWSGGSPAGSYTDPRGPDAAREMLRFFRDNPAAGPTKSCKLVELLGELIDHLPFVRRLVGRPLSSNSGRHRQASGTVKRLQPSAAGVNAATSPWSFNPRANL